MNGESKTQKFPAEKSARPVWTAANLARAEDLAQQSEDSFGFAFESLDEFSEAPLDFEEYTLDLIEDLEDVYYLTKVYNRFSPNYLSACEIFEQVIRRLGRCCVTKAVLQQKGLSFPKLDRLTADGLYACVSFNFRKCHTALKEGREKNILDHHLLKAECRLYELAEHLRATGEKIRLIASGKISADRMLSQASVFSEKREAHSGSEGHFTGVRNPSAFPVLGSAAREMLRKMQPAPAMPQRSRSEEKPVPPADAPKDAESKKGARGKAAAKAAWETDEELNALIRQSWEQLAKRARPMRKLDDPSPDEPRKKSPEKRKKKRKRV